MKVFGLKATIDKKNKAVTITIGRVDPASATHISYSTERHENSDILEALEEISTTIENNCGPIVSVAKTDKLITGEIFKEITSYHFLVFAREKQKPILHKRT